MSRYEPHLASWFTNTTPFLPFEPLTPHSSSFSCPPSLRPSHDYDAHGAPRLGSLGPGEVASPHQNATHIRHGVLEELEHDQGSHNQILLAHPSSLDNIRPDPQARKLLLGKQFPFKLYQMLEDDTVTNYVKWSTSEDRDAFFIPDIDAFTANVIPKHFKDMNHWSSFQKQLNNYGFVKHNRGAGKALYAHSGNKFRKCRPDLLHEVVRKPNPQPTHAYARQDSGSEQQRPTTFITPTLNSTLIQPGSQPIPPAEENQLEHENTWLKMKILVLERDLKYSEDRQLAMENRLRRAEGRLVELETQLIEPKKRPERIPTGEATLNPTVLPMTDHPVCNAEPRLSSRERIPEIQARMSVRLSGYSGSRQTLVFLKQWPSCRRGLLRTHQHLLRYDSSHQPCTLVQHLSPYCFTMVLKFSEKLDPGLCRGDPNE